MFNVIKFTFKTISNHVLFNIIFFIINFEDFNLIFYIWVFNTKLEVTMKKKSQFKQHFATTFRPLTKQNMVFVYWSTILVYFTMLSPTCLHYSHVVQTNIRSKVNHPCKLKTCSIFHLPIYIHRCRIRSNNYNCLCANESTNLNEISVNKEHKEGCFSCLEWMKDKWKTDDKVVDIYHAHTMTNDWAMLVGVILL